MTPGAVPIPAIAIFANLDFLSIVMRLEILANILDLITQQTLVEIHRFATPGPSVLLSSTVVRAITSKQLVSSYNKLDAVRLNPGLM